MIFNGVDVGVGKYECIYDWYMSVYSKDLKTYITVSFNGHKDLDVKTMKLNERTNMRDHLYWDNSIVSNDISYVFDSDKDEIYLTRLDNNKYRLEITVNKPDMIYTTSDESKSFDSIIVDTEISFTDNK